jgi:acyl-CoA thioester hydrolase
MSPTYQHTHRVTYSDCTVGNHIYYARYLDLIEAARNEFLRSIGHSFLHWQERDTIFPVVEAQLRYKSPARYDDVLTIEVRVTEAARIRLNFSYHIVNQRNELIAEAATHHVCTGLDERPKKLPPELLAALGLS